MSSTLMLRLPAFSNIFWMGSSLFLSPLLIRILSYPGYANYLHLIREEVVLGFACDDVEELCPASFVVELVVLGYAEVHGEP